MLARVMDARSVRSLGALVLLIAAAAFLFLHSSFFRVRAVRVSGHRQLDAAHVAGLAGVREGDNLWDTSPTTVENRLRQDPWIASAKVSRSLPGVWEVVVTERRAVAAVRYHGRFLALDGHGVSLGVVDELPRLNVPLVSGAEARDVVLGRVYPVADVSAALSAIAAMRPETVAALSEIQLGQGTDMTLYLEGALRVEMGRAPDVGARVADLEAILADLRRRGLSAQYVDLRFAGQPVVKLRE